MTKEGTELKESIISHCLPCPHNHQSTVFSGAWLPMQLCKDKQAKLLVYIPYYYEFPRRSYPPLWSFSVWWVRRPEKKHNKVVKIKKTVAVKSCRLGTHAHEQQLPFSVIMNTVEVEVTCPFLGPRKYWVHPRIQVTRRSIPLMFFFQINANIYSYLSSPYPQGSEHPGRSTHLIQQILC